MTKQKKFYTVKKDSKISARIAAAIAEAFREGEWPRNIARKFNITLPVCEKLLRNEGIDPDRYGRYDADDVDAWVAMYKGEFDGLCWSTNAIAREFNLPWSTVAIQLACRLGKLRHRSLAMKYAAERRAAKKKPSRRRR